MTLGGTRLLLFLDSRLIPGPEQSWAVMSVRNSVSEIGFFRRASVLFSMNALVAYHRLVS